MTKDDLKIAFNWAKQENWNPNLEELNAFYAADPYGYRMMWLDGQPIASLASVKYSENYAFFGLYIVIPEYRGQGYGKLLWDIAMKTVIPCTGIGLNGVMDQVDAYKRAGFSFSNLNTRWSTRLFNFNTDSANFTPVYSLTKDVPLDEVVALDFEASATYRPRFWNEVLEKSGSHFLAAKDDNRLKGFGVLSACANGYKFGPIYANDGKIAEDLVIALWKHIQSKDQRPDTTIQLDTTEMNSHASAFAQKLGFAKVFNTARMYKGFKPKMDESKIFGIPSLEIG